MSSPFSKGTLYLKRKHQDLLAQLESNSAILHERLKKLCTKAVSAGPSLTPQRSPLKRKQGYQSWLERNNSAQVSAVLHPGIFHDPTPSPVSNLDLVQLRYDDQAAAMSPSKRSRCFSPGTRDYPVPKTTLTSRNTRLKARSKKCPECYCQGPKQQETNEKHINKRSGHICTGCSNYKIPQNTPTTLDNYQSNLDLRRGLLDEARSVISYSPQSEFLKGLKKRSQVNLNEPTTARSENDPSEVVTAVDYERERSRTTASRISNITDTSKHTRQTTKGPSFVVMNQTVKSKPSRSTTRAKDPSFSRTGSIKAINKSKPSTSTTNGPSVRVINRTDKSKPSTSTTNGPSVRVIYHIDKSKPSRPRPATTSSSYGVSRPKAMLNDSDKSENSYRSDTSEKARKGSRRDQSRTSPSQSIGNSSVPLRSNKNPPHKPVAKTIKPPDDRPSRYFNDMPRPATTGSNTRPVPSTRRPPAANNTNHSPTKTFNRPDVSRLRPSHGRNPTTSPPILNVRPAAASSSRNKPPSLPKYNSRLGKSSTHSRVSPAKNRYTSSGKEDTHGKSSNTAKVKLRPSSPHVARGRASSKKSSHVMITTTNSPSSSPSRERFEDPTESRVITSLHQSQDNLRPPVESRSRHTSQVPERDPLSFFHAKENVETRPIAAKCYKKLYKNIHKPSCKKHNRKDCKLIKKSFEECYEEIGSPTEVRSPFSRCKRCHRKSARKQPMAGKPCCSSCCCGCQRPDECRRTCSCDRCGPSEQEWVDELSRYRKSHWFDCHSKPGDRERATSSARAHDHNGVHRYMLNDRLFPMPLHPSCIDCCKPCCLPRDDDARLPPRFRREITLCSMRNRDDLHVALPQVSRSRPKSEERKTGPLKIYHEPDKKTRASRKSTGCMLTHPIRSKSLAPRFLAPANSLALRYQKGII